MIDIQFSPRFHWKPWCTCHKESGLDFYYFSCFGGWLFFQWHYLTDEECSK